MVKRNNQGPQQRRTRRTLGKERQQNLELKRDVKRQRQQPMTEEETVDKQTNGSLNFAYSRILPKN